MSAEPSTANEKSERRAAPELGAMIVRPFRSGLKLLGFVIGVMLIFGYFTHWFSTNSSYRQFLQGFYVPEMRSRLVDGRWSEIQLLCERIAEMSEIGRIQFVRPDVIEAPVCDVVVQTPQAWTLVSEIEIPFGFSKASPGQLGTLKVQRFDHHSLPLLGLFLAMGSLFYVVISRMWMRKVQTTISNHVRSVTDIVRLIREDDGGSPLAESVRNVPVESREMEVIQTSISSYLEKTARLRDLEIESAKETAQKEMLRQLAHDLRSPLSSLKLISGTKKFFADMKAQQVLSAAVNAIQRQLEQAMAATRETPQMASKTTTMFDIRNVLQEIVQMNRMAHPNIEFALEMEEGAGICAVDVVALRRVLQNLVTNSRENLESIVGRTDPRVTIGLRLCDGDLILSVQDNGSGLPPEVRSSFGQKGLSIGKESGNGLGLAAAVAFIQASHGDIEVSSSPSEGTVIRFRIPAEIRLNGVSELASRRYEP